MAKQWHKVVVDGFAIYRASDSKAYVSYNVAKDSWSSKMLMGNIPCEQLAKAPKTIRVKGEAWGVTVERSYLEGERPVTHTIAFRGIGERLNWKRMNDAGLTGENWSAEREKEFMDPADPEAVYFYTYSFRDKARAVDNLEHYQEDMPRRDYNAVQLVELESR